MQDKNARKKRDLLSKSQEGMWAWFEATDIILPWRELSGSPRTNPSWPTNARGSYWRGSSGSNTGLQSQIDSSDGKCFLNQQYKEDTDRSNNLLNFCVWLFLYPPLSSPSLFCTYRRSHHSSYGLRLQDWPSFGMWLREQSNDDNI